MQAHPHAAPCRRAAVRRRAIARVCRGLARALPALLVSALLADPAPPANGYEVRFEGEPDKKLLATLEASCDAVALRHLAPPTNALLLRRGRADLDRVRSVLRAQGYLEAEVSVRLEDAVPPQLVFALAPGRLFRVGTLELETDPAAPPPARTLRLKPGDPAAGARVLALEAPLLQHIRLQGYPDPRITNRVYHADPATARLDIRLQVDPGPIASFGTTRIEGLRRVNEAFVRNGLRWKQGRQLDPEIVEETRKRMARSGLYATVDITNAATPDASGAVPLTVRVRERRRRSAELGVSYRTDEGAGARALWEHRNLGGDAERLNLAATLAQNTREAEASLGLPQIGHRDQTLAFSTRAADEQTDAYDSRNANAAVTLSRDWRLVWATHIGGSLRYERVESQDALEHFTLLSAPAGVRLNMADDLLDPRRGGRAQVSVEPFVDVRQTDTSFAKGAASLLGYLPLNREATWVLAGRLGGGAIAGEDVDDVPADVRFYAGGAGSIRGYAYQSVGPRADGDPTGGRSLVETSAEIRMQVTTTIGLVAFLDGGQVSTTTLAQFDEPLRWGTGLGLRYFAPIGPLRLDVATPINRRDGIDDVIQFYISIGQAF